jgi:hypothetical protein
MRASRPRSRLRQGSGGQASLRQRFLLHEVSRLRTGATSQCAGIMAGFDHFRWRDLSVIIHIHLYSGADCGVRSNPVRRMKAWERACSMAYKASACSADAVWTVFIQHPLNLTTSLGNVKSNCDLKSDILLIIHNILHVKMIRFNCGRILENKGQIQKLKV